MVDKVSNFLFGLELGNETMFRRENNGWNRQKTIYAKQKNEAERRKSLYEPITITCRFLVHFQSLVYTNFWYQVATATVKKKRIYKKAVDEKKENEK